jgi:putative methionine-R-sulfoxide reductase with GAF domain
VNVEPTIAQDQRFLDEDAFQKLLEAAYVLQRHNDSLAAKEPTDYAQAFAEVVEIQNLIQTQHLNLESAMKLIAERVQKITGAAGAAIGVVEGEQVFYRAASGSAVPPTGSRIPLDSSLSAYSLRRGQLLESPQAASDPRVDAQTCRERGAQSLVAVPLHHEGKISGVLEVAFVQPNAFLEQDVRTCQLMAGLVTEAIAKNAEREWKQALAVERATMLEALEKLKPQLERLVVEPQTRPPSQPEVVAASKTPAETPATSPTVTPAGIPATIPTETLAAMPIPQAEALRCGHCGHEFEPSEFFCGSCGTPREPEQTSTEEIQSKWATLWHLRMAEEQKESDEQAATPQYPSLDEIAAELEKALPDLAKDLGAEGELAASEGPPTSEDEFPAEAEVTIEPTEATALVARPAVSPATPEVWTSAATARQWLDSLKAQQPRALKLADLLRSQRANIYLGAAALLLLVVIFARPQSDPAQSVTSSLAASQSPAAARARRKIDPQQNLTLFEKMLVGLGIAEAPPAPVYRGNPDTKVWVDLHTALYYCPGAELYGNTPNGRFTTQRDAQQDQFEPALRKACD